MTVRCISLKGWWLVVLIAGGLCLPPSGGAETLGRLFFTPQERAALDRLRVERQEAGQDLDDRPGTLPQETESKEKILEIQDPVLSFQGMVLRSSGRQTIWLNDRAYSEKELPAGIKASGWTAREKMAIEVTHVGGVLTLKPGETAVIESVAPGAEQGQ